ncbi:MAG: hypothetical protein ACRERE_08575 [Candidatus Entotheonellia bacterium]
MFDRKLYDGDIEAKYFEPLLAEIERKRSGLAALPTETSLKFIKNSAMQRWLEQGGHDKTAGTLIFEIFNRMQFFWFSSVYKCLNLIDALAVMYNARNYLGWVLIGGPSSSIVRSSTTTQANSLQPTLAAMNL